MEFNSKVWLKKVKESMDSRRWDQPLLCATFSNLSGVIMGPELGSPSVEETLHRIDPSTPANQIYNDLIALELAVSLEELNLQLRDYPLPLLHM
jgi:hypothetical protein